MRSRCCRSPPRAACPTALRGALPAIRSSCCSRRPASRHVADPTAGAGWSEDLTEKLCRAAWALFQEIEAAGGLAVALEQGLIQKKVAAARTARERALADKKEALIGASEYPGVADVPVLDVPRVTLADLPAAVTCEPLTPVRLAAPFERA